MISVGFHVLLLSLVAGASLLALAATFVVIRGERPRRRGIAFAAGFLVGGAMGCGIGLLVGSTAVARLDSHETAAQALELALGIALLAYGLRERRQPVRGGGGETGRAAALLRRLGRVRATTAFSTAVPLGLGGPKRLALTLIAMTAISGADLGPLESGTLVVLYLAVATSLVWGPVGIVVLGGDRAAKLIQRGESWLASHAPELRVWLSLGFGAALIVDALLRLFA